MTPAQLASVPSVYSFLERYDERVSGVSFIMGRHYDTGLNSSIRKQVSLVYGNEMPSEVTLDGGTV